jgi:hypothetical protein
MVFFFLLLFCSSSVSERQHSRNTGEVQVLASLEYPFFFFCSSVIRKAVSLEYPILLFGISCFRKAASLEYPILLILQQHYRTGGFVGIPDYPFIAAAVLERWLRWNTRLSFHCSSCFREAASLEYPILLILQQHYRTGGFVGIPDYPIIAAAVLVRRLRWNTRFSFQQHYRIGNIVR